MPIFEYHCSDCDKRFEALVLSRKGEPNSCTECGGTSVEKVFSTFSAQTSNGEAPAAAEGLCNTCGVPGPCAMN
jgi:putative FmdB family regulatory protein